MKSIFRMFLLFFLTTVFSGCFRDASKKTSRELYNNHMDFYFSNGIVIKYSNLHFKLPNKFKKDYYLPVNTNGKKCLTYSVDELSLYFSISEVNEEEASKIRYLTNEGNTLKAIQYDAVKKRKKSINSNTKSSEVRTLNYRYAFLYQAVTEPYTREYKWDTNSTSTYYIASFKKDNHYFVIQFTGKGENLRYFLDDFKRMLKTFN